MPLSRCEDRIVSSLTELREALIRPGHHPDGLAMRHGFNRGDHGFQLRIPTVEAHEIRETLGIQE